MPILLDIPTTREALGGISRSKLYAMIWAGQIDPVKIGRRTMFRRETVERIVAHGA